ncbi:hypothetical protein BBJ28_00024062 [Nothophytophthora sp. Chile5]|nr:hypothetical protein BBJ28_00024062 [Nothophytophthora sp. Chile5]
MLRFRRLLGVVPARLEAAEPCRRALSTTSGSFNLLYLIPIIGGALLVVLLLLWLLGRCRRRRKSEDQTPVFDTPPLLEAPSGASAAATAAATLVSPMDPSASFSSMKDAAEPGGKNVWLSGSGRTLGSARSGSSKSLSSSATAPDYELDPTQRDEVFQVLNYSPALASHRLAVDKIAFERMLGESPTRQLWLCQFEGEEIVVKRLVAPPQTAEVFPALLNFVYETQLAASLDHPNIARFLGVAWGHSLRSLCFVTEYLVHGDVASFLHRSRKRRQQLAQHASSSSTSDASAGSSTTAPGTGSGASPPPPLQSSGSGLTFMNWLEDKLPLAVGVARALTYLHSRRPKPVVYRALRARKVALNDRFEPKLIDFSSAVDGGSPVDQEALAAGVGDAYWTAPELLMGGSATQASDIYAFGVLLAELDSEARRPYHNVRDPRSGEKLRAFQVLNLVAGGQLRPQFGASCPKRVRELATACVRQNPAQRPSARELLQILESSAA